MIGISWSKTRSTDGAKNAQRLARSSDFNLDGHVTRWIAAGAITAEQGNEILRIDGELLRVEPDASGSPDAVPRRMSPSAELAAYLGIVVVLVSGGITANRLWSVLQVGGRMTVGLTIGGLGLGGGYAISRLNDEPTTRLSRFLWFTGAGGVAMTAAVFVDWSSGHRNGWTFLAVGIVLGVLNGVLWRNLERPLQFLGTGAGLLFIVGAMSNFTKWHPGALTAGLAYWIAAVVLAALSLRVIRPAATALVVAECGSFLAAMAVTSSIRALGILLGLLGAAIGVGLGLSTKRSVVTALGVLSFFISVVRLVSFYLKGPVTTLVAFVLGVCLVGAIIWRSTRSQG